MITPKVSIIIPLYNHAQALAQCLQSIKNQTFQDYEIIIVNDGSTDIKPMQLESTIKQFNNLTIRIIHQPNQGAPVARNRGFNESRGVYVLFCDADVVMRPDMLEKMSRVLDENPNVSYVYSSFKFGWKKFKLWEFDAEKLKQMPYIHTTSLIRREHFPGFDPTLKRMQDWDLWLTMLEQGHVGKLIPEILFAVKTGGTMSKWLPSFLTKIGLGKKASQYQEAVKIIKDKHHLL
ncbi:MAG: hypothetical protein A3H70_02660 [Candidatus Komeilibacteria bacterium RIFCSPLOWO2_02_FULL_48_11]|uniref:Glycosyltransferase 2-like domain-containing protein n=1 Tax=Candidatus Komeilibacteria bacterium RIFCSPLOWO2_02_FULL_48_11 TaxID=1798553 RepID=A0A1G2BQF2_9BACT|nr:MAG: hypothetical protein A3H70_02660 [Candidatus Komeilibacteria bacterium RIFCSPLOWO2_02_FULL_48_11]